MKVKNFPLFFCTTENASSRPVVEPKRRLAAGFSMFFFIEGCGFYHRVQSRLQAGASAVGLADMANKKPLPANRQGPRILN